MTSSPSGVLLRDGTHADDPAIHELFRDSVEDLVVRLGVEPAAPVNRAERAARWEALYRPLFAHLTSTAESYVIAETDRGLAGYARVTFRDGLRELTEFFVAPDSQALGVGRALLERAFPAAGADHLLIIATIDNRAQARYLRAGCYPQFPLLGMYAAPRPCPGADELTARPIGAEPDVEVLAAVDRVVLGHRRDVDHGYLATHRHGFVYERAGRLAGYGYVSAVPGPVAAFEANDIAPILAHLETVAADTGIAELDWELPGTNRVALAHLLARGFKVSPWYNFVMMDAPFGQFDRYLVSSPTFFI